MIELPISQASQMDRQEIECGHMGWSHDREMAPVDGGHRVNAKPLSNRDNAGIRPAKRQVTILPDQDAHTPHVIRSDVDNRAVRAIGKILEEGGFNLGTKLPTNVVADFR